MVSLANRYMREEGAYTTLICTTNGDVGTVDPEYMKGYTSIADLRLAEFACATEAAGFNEVVTLGYRDSGMMGTPDNDHPESSWTTPLEVITGQIVEVMRRVRPQVVMTFNSFGAYGHPDHIKINQATLAAFQSLQSEPEHPEKLYYATGPNQLFRIGIWMMRLLGRDPQKAGRNHDVNLVAAVEATTPVTTKVAVARYIDLTWKALDCYPSQIQLPPIARRFRRLAGTLFQRSVALSRVSPVWRRGEKIERDLFENIA
jgi:LmbE family N-acetylglucosaminyl deacetylase